jgi:hypothetical protein
VGKNHQFQFGGWPNWNWSPIFETEQELECDFFIFLKESGCSWLYSYMEPKPEPKVL